MPMSPISGLTAALKRLPSWVKARKGQCEHKVSAVHPTTDIRRLAATFVARVAYHARSGRPVGPPASGKLSPISTRLRLSHPALAALRSPLKSIPAYWYGNHER